MSMSFEWWEYLLDTLGNCNTLQHTATHCNTHCNTLQHTATHCNTIQHTTTHYNTLQHTTTHCNALQRTATYCNTLQHTATHCNTLHHTATYCNILQHITILARYLEMYRVAKIRRMPGCLTIGRFPQKSPTISDFFAERDLQLKASCASSPPFTTYPTQPIELEGFL